MLQRDKINLLKDKYEPFALDEEFSISKALSVPFLNDLVYLEASLTGIDLFELTNESEIKYLDTQEYSGITYQSYNKASDFLFQNEYDIFSINFEVYDDYNIQEKLDKICKLFDCDLGNNISVSKPEYIRFLTLCFNLQLAISDSHIVTQAKKPLNLAFARNFANIEHRLSHSGETSIFSIQL